MMCGMTFVPADRVAREMPENLTDSTDRPLEPDRHFGTTSDDLRSRLNELPESHPSAISYFRERALDGPQHSFDRTHRQAPTTEADRHPERPDRDARGLPEPADHLWTDQPRVSADRRVHILDGDNTGGGHRHGTGRPDKTEFPADWDDDHTIDAILAVVRKPDHGPKRQEWNGRWEVSGTHEGVKIFAIVESDGFVCTAWPVEGSPGVVKNHDKET
jgi:Bacterial EndoU nuclease